MGLKKPLLTNTKIFWLKKFWVPKNSLLRKKSKIWSSLNTDLEINIYKIVIKIFLFILGNIIVRDVN